MHSSSASKKVSCVLWTTKFIPAYITAQHLFLFHVRPIQSSPPSPNRFLLDILILLFHLCLGLPSDVFSHQTLHAHLLLSICAPCPTNFILLDFITWAILVRSANWWGVQIKKLLSVQYLLVPCYQPPSQAQMSSSVILFSKTLKMGHQSVRILVSRDMFDIVY